MTAKHLQHIQHNMFYICDYTAVCQLETSAREDLLQFSSIRYPLCHFKLKAMHVRVCHRVYDIGDGVQERLEYAFAF